MFARMLLFFAGQFFFILTQAHALGPVALVYEGPGSCSSADGDCSGAAERAVLNAGYQVRRVGPAALDSQSTQSDRDTLFQNAAVWVQPGGSSKKFLEALTPEMKSGIQSFVGAGHGYVGFCAGAFASTAKDGDLTLDGLSLLPGRSHPYPNETLDHFFDSVMTYFNPQALYNQILEVTWAGKKRQLYFEEGPSLDFAGVPPEQIEVTATLRNGLAVAARGNFKKGRVYVTGSHPEAPLRWRGGLADEDGLDYDLVQEMLDWVTANETRPKP